MPTPRGLVQQVDQLLHRSVLLPQRAKLVVAVSGGADSVALLRLLHAINQSDYWEWTLHVAHVHHGIRGRSAADDARFVQRLAKELGLRVTLIRLKLGKDASEAAARTGRFRALKQVVRKVRAAGVLMAHHADDQAETLLLRLIRGTGIDGLSAMAVASEIEGLVVLRPLLHVRRQVLREHLREIGQAWRDDETNESPRYLRNRIRHETIPHLESLNPGVTAALARTAQLAADAQSFIDSQLHDVLVACLIAHTNAAFTLKREPLQRIHPYLCAELLRTLAILLGGSTESADFERIREATRVVQAKPGGKSVQLGGSIIVTARAGSVSVEKHP